MQKEKKKLFQLIEDNDPQLLELIELHPVLLGEKDISGKNVLHSLCSNIVLDMEIIKSICEKNDKLINETDNEKR